MLIKLLLKIRVALSFNAGVAIRYCIVKLNISFILFDKLAAMPFIPSRKRNNDHV